MPLFDDVKRKVLDNGLEILVREDHSSPVVALNFFVRVGSLNENDDIAGWSHGIEHMLFKGTERRGTGDIARETANAGGQTNAGTGYESTNYYIILPRDNFETALDIHADVLRHSTFDEFELEKERQVLIKENEMYRDRPSGFGITWESLLELAFTNHRYARPIGGPDENLLRVGRAEILAYKETYYVPNNITYVVVGDVDAEDVFAAMEEKLGSWPRQDFEPDTSTPEPRQEVLRYGEGHGDVEKRFVKIGFHLPPELHPDTDAIMVLANILATGRSSRLYRRVREEKGLIVHSSMMETTGNDPGYMSIEFTAEQEKAKDALLAVFTEILRFQHEPVTAAEIERTLRSVQADTLYTLETMEGQAHMLGHYALLGDYKLAGGYLDRLATVTPSRIQAAARKYLGIERATVFAYGPRDAEPLAPDASALADLVREAASVPSVEPVAGDEGKAHSGIMPAGSGRARDGVEAVTLDSGTRVLLQADGRLPLVALSACLPSGSGNESAEQAGVIRLTQNCMLKGAGGRTAAEIAEAIDRMGARVRPFSGRDASGFSVGMVRQDLSPMMDLFETVLSRPEFPPAAVERERDRTLVELASLRDDTVQHTVTQFFGLMFPHHAYGRPSLGTEDSVARLTPADLSACHARMYDPSRMVIGVVGDFDRGEMLDRLEKLVASLPRGGGGDGAVPEASSPKEPVRRELAQEVSQAVVVMGYPGPRSGSEDRYALDVWESVLSGMGNRLFTRLRDEQHLCYFTGAFGASFRRGGALIGYVGTGAEHVDRAIDGLKAELELTTRELATDEELIRAKNNLAGNYLTGMQTRMSWASTYAEDEIMGLGYEEALRYVDEIGKVTAEEVKNAAARYVDAGRLVVAVLRPSGDSVSVGETVEA